MKRKTTEEEKKGRGEGRGGKSKRRKRQRRERGWMKRRWTGDERKSRSTQNPKKNIYISTHHHQQDQQGVRI